MRDVLVDADRLRRDFVAEVERTTAFAVKTLEEKMTVAKMELSRARTALRVDRRLLDLRHTALAKGFVELKKGQALVCALSWKHNLGTHALINGAPPAEGASVRDDVTVSAELLAQNQARSVAQRQRAESHSKHIAVLAKLGEKYNPPYPVTSFEPAPSP